MGFQRQPPQRSLSGTNINQRPPSHRTLSQQGLSSSATKRINENFADLAFDGSDIALGRYGTIPRIGGSRLKLEVSKDSNDSPLVESPRPTSDATPSWGPLPPRGRPHLHFDLPSISAAQSRTAQGGAPDTGPLKPMPLPVRPGQHAPPSVDRARAIPGNLVKKDARPKPYVLEVPAVAPHFPPDGHADFFPWNGNHPEDQFSEPVIRQGFFDKTQMTQNETGSAKASIFPAVKHKSGLQTLSSLFTSVLTQRRAHGQITSSSTFKPPPRVTVTDTKREMWLKDLANPTISLRRLSRSIPHGIRGKVLLDQSLSKNIPIERAVWLAKCVGANELRSFRRKGVSGTFAMGGEAKWIRDFTVCVEQFVEGAVGVSGEKDFRKRITYAIRLATHFYAEYLLDREHYMDWLVSSLENSAQSKLPMWILISQIYWKDLLRYRRYGRRLSDALLSQLSQSLNHPDRDILAPLSDRLKVILKGLMASNPESFISPRVWTKHKGTLWASLASDDMRFEPIFAAIDRRNERLTPPSLKKEPTARQRLIRLLDTSFSQALATDLPGRCWQIDDNKAMLTQTVLEWSTSRHRPGITKIFVGARILRLWSKLGADVTRATLKFLDSGLCGSGRSKSAFYHLISELARSDHFSIPVYLQWLIARGGIYDRADLAQDGPCATRLLAELPTHNLSASMIELRRTLLDRAGFSMEDEEQQTRACIHFMDRSLPRSRVSGNLGVNSSDIAVKEALANISSEKLSRTSKSEIGLWLRQKVGFQMLQHTMPPFCDWDDAPTKRGAYAIAASDFNIIRQYFEFIDDYSMLADVLKNMTSLSDADVLASCADTLDLHSKTFAAIGALQGLFDALLRRMRSLTDDLDSLPRVFLVSMADLAARMPGSSVIAQHLNHELTHSDMKTAADACSPVSDHMGGVLQTTEADFTDEIEKVLASGNSMDRATLERLFQRISLQYETSWEKSPEQQRGCGLLLTRLRTFDNTQFDILMSAWVNRFLQLKSRPSMMQILGILISFGCLALRDVMANCSAIIDKGTKLNGPTASGISQEALTLLIAPWNLPGLMTIEEAYRLRIKQRHMQSDNPLETLCAIRHAFEEFPSAIGDDTQLQSFNSKNILNSQEVHELLQRLVLVDTTMAMQTLVLPLVQRSKTGAPPAIIATIDRLLIPESNETTTVITTETVLNLADDLILPFCQVKLASGFGSESGIQHSEDDLCDHLESFDKAIESAVATGNTTWACIIPLLDISIAQHLRQYAEIQFFAILSKIGNSAQVSKMEHHIAHARTLLSIIDATAYTITANGPTNSNNTNALAPEIVTTLNDIWLLLSTIQAQDTKDIVIAKWLPLLLSFATIHAQAFEPSKTGHESRPKALLALAAILLELQGLSTNTDAVNVLVEQTFDLALHLVTSLPDDLRQQCIRELRDSISNPRICYIFSFATNPSDWLVLSQSERLQDRHFTMANGSGDGRGSEKERLVPFPLRRWEMLGEPTPNVGENDTSLSLTLFGARRG